MVFPRTRVEYELLDVADKVRSTESTITSASGLTVSLNTKHWIKYLNFYFLLTRVLGHFQGKFSVIKKSVSIFEQTTGYRIYTVSREPIILPEIQYPLFSI